MRRKLRSPAVPLLWATLCITGCGAGTSTKVPGKNIRYRINDTSGFHIFAVTGRYKQRLFSNPWSDVKYQATTSDGRGYFSLHTPHNLRTYRMRIVISKIGYRVWSGLLRGDNVYGENMRKGNVFVVKKAASKGQEAVALDGVRNLTGMGAHCHKKGNSVCTAYRAHLAERKRHLQARIRANPTPKYKWGRTRIESWAKFRKDGLELLGAAQVGGGLLAVLESYHISWYYKKYAPGQKWLGQGKWNLRNHPEVRRRSHLVLVDGQNRVVFRAPIADTRFGRTALYKIDDFTLALLASKGKIHVFDVRTRTFTRTIQLSKIKSTPRTFAMGSGGGDIFVAGSKNTLQRYNAQGIWQSSYTLKNIRVIRRLYLGDGGACLVHGDSISGYNYGGVQLGDVWRFGMALSLVQVDRHGDSHRERTLIQFADALAVTGKSIWVLRRALVPSRIKALLKSERRALARSEYERERLYNYSLAGKLQRTIDVTSRVAASDSAKDMDIVRGSALLVYRGGGTLSILNPPSLR